VVKQLDSECWIVVQKDPNSFYLAIKFYTACAFGRDTVNHGRFYLVFMPQEK